MDILDSVMNLIDKVSKNSRIKQDLYTFMIMVALILAIILTAAQVINKLVKVIITFVIVGSEIILIGVFLIPLMAVTTGTRFLSKYVLNPIADAAFDRFMERFRLITREQMRNIYMNPCTSYVNKVRDNMECDHSHLI
nr:putative G protein [Styphnolobium-associated cytorhabdovirus]